MVLDLKLEAVQMPIHPFLTPAEIQQAWRFLNPAAGEHLSQLELSQNGQAVLPSFQAKDAAVLTGPSSLLTYKQLEDILASADLKVAESAVWLLFCSLSC